MIKCRILISLYHLVYPRLKRPKILFLSHDHIKLTEELIFKVEEISRRSNGICTLSLIQPSHNFLFLCKNVSKVSFSPQGSILLKFINGITKQRRLIPSICYYPNKGLIREPKFLEFKRLDPKRLAFRLHLKKNRAMVQVAPVRISALKFYYIMLCMILCMTLCMTWRMT